MDKGAESYLKYLSGDDEGIAEIVTLYKDKLIFFINGYVKNICVAEELTEDTFFKLMIKKPKFSPKYSFKTWLFVIGKNMALDYLRKNAKRKEISEEDMEKAADIKDIQEDFERNIIIEEDKKALHKAIEKLAPQYRQTLHLIYFENFTNGQAARIMNKTKRQTEMLLYRAKAALKAQLEKEGFVYENR